VQFWVGEPSDDLSRVDLRAEIEVKLSEVKLIGHGAERAVRMSE
jgi:hypothetical protein